MKIPKLYQTEDEPLDEKTIYQKYEIPYSGFYWLVAELDPKTEMAFGYANLNNEQNAEWGYISIDELRKNGAVQVEDWKPVKYKDIVKDEEHD
jgi:hypothetical protein